MTAPPGKPSRRLWTAAIVVSVLCVAGLAYGLVSDWNTPAVRSAPRAGTSSGSGFGVGLVIGIGAGVVLGSLLALRKRD